MLSGRLATVALVDRSALTPTQLRVVEELMGAGQERPTFDPNLPVRLRDELEQHLGPVVAALGEPPVEELAVSKRALAQVHACEAHHVAQEADGFTWSVATARGTVAHKAIELSVFLAGDPVPLDLVDAALDRLEGEDDGWGPAPFLQAASPVERAELRAGANELVAKFLDTWPPLDAKWRPCLEASVRIALCDDRLVLRSRADLVLGAARGPEARRLIVDFKSGRPYPTHADDLRYYALLDTLRCGVPPFRVASSYLDAGTFHAEDVTEDVLHAAVRRVVAGVEKLVELRTGGRPPTIAPGPTCSYCLLNTTCAGARQWAEQRAHDGLVDEPV
jgi:hypothetical protein